MNLIEQRVADRLEMVLNEEPVFRKVLAGMLIQDKGDLTEFVKTFFSETTKQFIEKGTLIEGKKHDADIG